MSNRVGLSSPSRVGSGFGWGAGETLSLSSITTLLFSGCVANLKIAAEKLFKEDAAKSDLNLLNDKFEELRQHILLLKEKLPNAFNEKAMLKMKLKDDEKLCEGLESEFSSTMTLCDQLKETLQHLADQVQDVGEDTDCFEVELSASLIALGILNDRLKSHSVGNSDEELRERKLEPSLSFNRKKRKKAYISTEVIGASIIDIKSTAIFRSQLHIAQMSNSRVVLLFYDIYTPSYDIVFPLFADLTDKYDATCHANNITFFKVDVKARLKRFKVKVKSLPTVVVIKGDGEEVGRISIAESITAPAFVEGLRILIDDCCLPA